MIDAILIVYSFITGICIGSFLNVCIHRLPLDESVIKPRSRCPECRKLIPWFRNIPLFSYIGQKAKCFECGAKIPGRYFIVELLTGLIWMGCMIAYGLSWYFLAAVLLLSVLLAITITDFETGLIPDEYNVIGGIAGFILVLLSPSILGEETITAAALEALLGALIGAGILYLTAWLGELLFKKESMGFGDIKMMAMLGVFLGMEKIVFVFFLAPFLSMPVALYARLRLKSETIPFGPYLALAAAGLFLCGEPIMAFIYSLMNISR